MKTPMKSISLATISIALVIIMVLLDYFVIGVSYFPGVEYYPAILFLILITATPAFLRGIKEKNRVGIILSLLSLIFFIGRFLLFAGYHFWWLKYFYF